MTRYTAFFLLCLGSFIPGAAAGAQIPDSDGIFETNFHVSPSGSDANPGTPERPFKTIARAVNRATPSTRILVHAGTYREVVEPRVSGRPGKIIVLRGADDGAVVIKPPLRGLPCGGLSPTRERAIRVLEGIDHWRIRNLTIVGGILVSGRSQKDLAKFVFDRSLPGRGEYDPGAAAKTLPLLQTDPSDAVEIWSNKIQGRGIYVFTSRYGHIADNEISDIDCGTGGGIWLGRFSDGWTVRHNYVHHIDESREHSLTEGIRLVGASMYSTIEGNLVQDVAGLGRGISTDANAGWNVFRRNTVRRTSKGFNEQTGGWGNKWILNLAENNRDSGFAIDVKDNGLGLPDDGVPAYLEMRCNVAKKNGSIDLDVGAIQASGFEDNAFGQVRLFSNVRSYWKKAKNSWEGSSTPPPPRPEPKRCGASPGAAL